MYNARRTIVAHEIAVSNWTFSSQKVLLFSIEKWYSAVERNVNVFVFRWNASTSESFLFIHQRLYYHQENTSQNNLKTIFPHKAVMCCITCSIRYCQKPANHTSIPFQLSSNIWRLSEISWNVQGNTRYCLFCVMHIMRGIKALS